MMNLTLLFFKNLFDVTKVENLNKNILEIA